MCVYMRYYSEKVPNCKINIINLIMTESRTNIFLNCKVLVI